MSNIFLLLKNSTSKRKMIWYLSAHKLRYRVYLTIKEAFSQYDLEIRGVVMLGKSINLFLMDGDPNGCIKCTLANWIGIAYKIPRTMLDKVRNIKYLNQSGVYLLFGTSDGDPVVYIGHAGIRKNGQGILNRWEEHKRSSNKDWWTEAVALTTSNNSFGSTEISYLENRFYNMAKEADRYEVNNDNAPTKGNLTGEKESEMEEFISYAKLVIGALGYKVFEPLIANKAIPEPTATTEPETLFIFIVIKQMLQAKELPKVLLFVPAAKLQQNPQKVLRKMSRNSEKNINPVLRMTY